MEFVEPSIPEVFSFKLVVLARPYTVRPTFTDQYWKLDSEEQFHFISMLWPLFVADDAMSWSQAVKLYRRQITPEAWFGLDPKQNLYRLLGGNDLVVRMDSKGSVLFEVGSMPEHLAMELKRF